MAVPIRECFRNECISPLTSIFSRPQAKVSSGEAECSMVIENFQKSSDKRPIPNSRGFRSGEEMALAEEAFRRLQTEGEASTMLGHYTVLPPASRNPRREDIPACPTGDGAPKPDAVTDRSLIPNGFISKKMAEHRKFMERQARLVMLQNRPPLSKRRQPRYRKNRAWTGRLRERERPRTTAGRCVVRLE